MDKKLKLLADLKAKKCLKVIAGINNFNFNQVAKIVKASDILGVSCVDISADVDIIKHAVQTCTQTAVMVSSLLPEELATAQELGADLIELGNFEALYDKGIYYSAKHVYELAHEIIGFRKNSLVSVTIPGYLSVGEQIELALNLEDLGVDILQTEGAALVEASSAMALGQIEKTRLTLANTMELAKTVETAFIITASAITPDTAKLAIAAGASGVGVGKYINKLETEIELLAAIKSLQEALEPAATYAISR